MALFAATMVVAGCGQNPKKKHLVIYYSQTGATHQVACELARMLDADTLRIDVEQPYDGTYQETIERCLKEMESGELPAVKELNLDLSRYETVFLGYPIWFGTYAPPIAALIKEYDFAGKKIIPFCTFGSGGLGTSIEHLRKALPQAEILPGYGVRNARTGKAHAEVERFLVANGFLEGEVTPLPEYSAQQPVTPEEAEIFNAACGNYQYPLGTPVTVGKRQTPSGTDYCFKSQGKGPDGRDILTTIYVTVGNEGGAVPEFTEVVR